MKLKDYENGADGINRDVFFFVMASEPPAIHLGVFVSFDVMVEWKLQQVFALCGYTCVSRNTGHAAS